MTLRRLAFATAFVLGAVASHASADTLVFRQPFIGLVVAPLSGGSGGSGGAGGQDGGATTPPTVPAKVVASPATLTFDTTPPGSQSSALTVTLTNSGGTSASLATPTLTGPFSATGTTCKANLAAGSSCTINVAFSPSTSGSFNGNMSVTAGASVETVAMTAIAAANGIAASGQSRTWADGTVAASCSAYLHGDGVSGHTYKGVTGDGTYRIALGSGASQDVTCDMTTDGGGWTLVMAARASNVSGWYTASGALNPAGLASGTGAAKLADTDIQNLTVDALRLNGPQWAMKRFVKPACRYNHRAQPFGTACGTTYGSLSWDSAKTTDYNGPVAAGIVDVVVGNDSEFIQTNDSRGFGWFVGNGVTHQYGAGNGAYQTPSDFFMWAR